MERAPWETLWSYLLSALVAHSKTLPSLPFALDPKSRAVRSGRRHPFERMRSIMHPSTYRDALKHPRKNIEHRLPQDECGRAERDGQRIVHVCFGRCGTRIAYSVVSGERW